MIKIVALSIIFSIVLFLLKNINSDMFVPALIVSGVVIISFGISYLGESINFFGAIIEKTSIDAEFFKIIIKVLGISYLVEFGASTIEDMGYKGLADKLIFVGKIIILFISLPIFYSVFNLINDIVK